MSEEQKNLKISLPSVELEGLLAIPKGSQLIVVFAHGSGSGRLSPRNNFVARVLRKHGMATLLFDLLTEKEDLVYENRFDIELLTQRLVGVYLWLTKNSFTKKLKTAFFGASTGSAAALRAAALLGEKIAAVVSRGGRTDLAGESLERVKAPTLLIVGGLDYGVIEINEESFKQLGTQKRLEIVAGATHLFEEPGALEKVAELAAQWFKRFS